MIGHIYLIRNLVNGKGYVGQTKVGINKRFAQHKTSASMGSTLAIHCAIRKYGVENFSVQQIACCEVGHLLNELEEHYIEFFGTFGHGYNMTSGGNVSVHSQETIEKIRTSRSKYRPSLETRIKLSKALVGNKRSVGRKHSAETRAKMSLSRTGLIGPNKGGNWTEARRLAHLKRFEGAIQ